MQPLGVNALGGMAGGAKSMPTLVGSTLNTAGDELAYLPAGWQAGDLAIIVMRQSPSSRSGWTPIQATSSTIANYRFLNGSESSPINLGASSGEAPVAVAVFRGVSSIQIASTGVQGGTGTNVTVPGLTTTEDNCLALVLGISNSDADGTLSVAGYTTIQSYATNDGDGGGAYIGYKEIPVAGVVPDASYRGSGLAKFARMVALYPA